MPQPRRLPTGCNRIPNQGLDQKAAGGGEDRVEGGEEPQGEARQAASARGMRCAKRCLVDCALHVRVGVQTQKASKAHGSHVQSADAPVEEDSSDSHDEERSAPAAHNARAKAHSRTHDAHDAHVCMLVAHSSSQCHSTAGSRWGEICRILARERAQRVDSSPLSALRCNRRSSTTMIEVLRTRMGLHLGF